MVFFFLTNWRFSHPFMKKRTGVRGSCWQAFQNKTVGSLVENRWMSVSLFPSISPCWPSRAKPNIGEKGDDFLIYLQGFLEGNKWHLSKNVLHKRLRSTGEIQYDIKRRAICQEKRNREVGDDFSVACFSLCQRLWNNLPFNQADEVTAAVTL